jgi:hypothetical protein
MLNDALGTKLYSIFDSEYENILWSKVNKCPFWTFLFGGVGGNTSQPIGLSVVEVIGNILETPVLNE